MGVRKIDKANWARRPHFEYFEGLDHLSSDCEDAERLLKGVD